MGSTDFESVFTAATGDSSAWELPPKSRSHSSSWVLSEKSAETAPAWVPVAMKGCVSGAHAKAAVRWISLILAMLWRVHSVAGES